MGVFTRGMTLELCMAALKRPAADTSLTYLASVVRDIYKGRITSLGMPALLSLLQDTATSSLYNVLHNRRENSTDSVYTHVSEEQRQLSQIDIASDLQKLMALAMQDESSDGAEEDEEDEDDEEDQDEAGISSESLLWTPVQLPPFDENHSIFYSIFFRINGPGWLFAQTNLSKNKVLDRKVYRFTQAHLDLVKCIDSLNDVSNASLGGQHKVQFLYRPLGESRYAVDKRFMQVTTMHHVCKQTPLEIIEQEYPTQVWRVEVVANAIKQQQAGFTNLQHAVDLEWSPLGAEPPLVATHCIYYAIVYILNALQEHMDTPFRKEGRGGPVYDALWAYYVSFVHFFEQCSDRMDDFYLMTPIGSTMGRDGSVLVSDRVTPWERIGPLIGTGIFHAGDLPDLHHILMSIPLWGEQKTPNYFLGKVYHKVLPFACQRRHIIKLIVQSVNRSEAFASLFSRLAWVMLAGLYPGELGSFDCYIGMRDLLRIKELTDSKELLVNSLCTMANSTGGGPLIILSIFSMHVLYMASFNPQYVEHANRCIDWASYQSAIVHLSNVIRSKKLFAQDPFLQARTELSKTVKSPYSHVHRLRRKSVCFLLASLANKSLERTLFLPKQRIPRDCKVIEDILRTGLTPAQEKRFRTETLCGIAHQGAVTMQTLRSMLTICNEAEPYFKNLLSRTHFKGPILNKLLDMDPAQHLTLDAFAMLRLPEFGGVADKTVLLMNELVRVYYDNATAGSFETFQRQMLLQDFMVVSFYFNMVALLAKMSFVPLPAEMVRATDHAMMTRGNRLYPGETVPESCYTISVTLCCTRVCTIMGSGKHGDKDIAYDVETEQLICAKGRRFTAKEEEDEDEEDEDEDDEKELDLTAPILVDENDIFNPIQFCTTNNLIAPAIAPDNVPLNKRMQAKLDSKELRNERNQWNRVPCGQGVLQFSLRGRALVWGDTLERKTQYLFCPQCASLHVYTILNFAASEDGTYRCHECARKELMHVEHISCAYCKQSSTSQVKPELKLPVFSATGVLEWLHFCKAHYRIASRYCRGDRVIQQPDLWKIIKHTQSQNVMRIARGNYKR